MTGGLGRWCQRNQTRNTKTQLDMRGVKKERRPLALDGFILASYPAWTMTSMRGRKVDTEYAAQSIWHGQDIVEREQTEARSESKLKGMSRQSVAKKKREKSSKQTDVPRGYRSAIGAQATDMTQVYPVGILRSSVETEMGHGVQGEAEGYVSFFSLSSISTQAEISCSLILCLIAPLATSALEPTSLSQGALS